MIISSANKVWVLPFQSACLSTLAKTSSTMLNKTGEIRHLHLVLISKEKSQPFLRIVQ